MRVRVVIGVVGELLRWFCPAFAVPAVLAAVEGSWLTAGHFLLSLVLTLAAGALGLMVSQRTIRLHRSEALGVVTFTWLAVGFFGALPYVFAGLDWVDALFESISGFTTTGATILTDFSLYGRPFFLWRAMTQWFGGLGVVALFVVVLPRLGIAGRQLFFAEASTAPGEAVSPQVRKSAGRLWAVYGSLTLLLAVILWALGMGFFDSVLHALTTIAAGGFSPNPESIAGYHSPGIEWALSPFMLLAGTSFTLQYRVYTGRVLGFFEDGEFLFYLSFTVIVAVGVAAVLSDGLPSWDALRAAVFQSTSLVSSTGFASVDYNLWADGARALLLVVMVVGGCAGSAAGGPKCVRHLLVFKHVAQEITTVLHPRAVLPVRYKGRGVPREIMRSVITLLVLYIAGYFALGTVLVLMGADLVLGYSAAIACLGNIGPAFGAAGPMGSFALFSDPAKVLLTAAMWIGRLEIVTVLALLHPTVLRNLRTGDSA